MPGRISVDFSQLDALGADLETLPRGYFRGRMAQQLAAAALQQHQDRFGRRVAPDGTPWAPRKDAKSHPLLEDTRRLRRSLRAVPGGRQRERIDVKSWGVPYAMVHQGGSRKRNIPARPFLGFGEGDLLDLAGIAADSLARFVGEAL